MPRLILRTYVRTISYVIIELVDFYHKKIIKNGIAYIESTCIHYYPTSLLFCGISLYLLGLQKSREVKVSGGHLLPCHLKAGLLERIPNNLLLMKVCPSRLAGTGEQLTDLLQQRVVPCLGGKGDQYPIVGQRAQMSDHLCHLFRGVMNSNINASDSIIVASDRLQVRGVELGIFDAKGLGTGSSLASHGIRNVTGRNFGAWYSFE